MGINLKKVLKNIFILLFGVLLFFWSFGCYGKAAPLISENQKNTPSNSEITLTPGDFSAFEDGFCSSFTVTPFAKAIYTFDSKEISDLQIRTYHEGEALDDWISISKSGQVFVQQMDGILSLDFFGSNSKENEAPLIMEIKIEGNTLPEFSEIRISFEQENSLLNTVVMVIVMLFAGAVFYVKKNRQLTSQRNQNHQR